MFLTACSQNAVDDYAAKDAGLNNILVNLSAEGYTIKPESQSTKPPCFCFTDGALRRVSDGVSEKEFSVTKEIAFLSWIVTKSVESERHPIEYRCHYGLINKDVKSVLLQLKNDLEYNCAHHKQPTRITFTSNGVFVFTQLMP